MLAGLQSTAVEAEVLLTIEDWSIRIDGDAVFLAASEADFGIEFELTGLDRIVLQGDRGLDQKGPERGNASYYYSAPRLTVTGELHSAGRPATAVTGTAWLDREWGTSALSPGVAGWDWFALQLDDGTDLMFYRLRTEDGQTSPFSGGSLTTNAGSTRRLAADSVALEATRDWTSPATRIRYPVEWSLSVPDAGLDLKIIPRIDNQEIDLTVRYWEGAVSVSGTSGDSGSSGVGYLELAGY
jgi:predicted secreted hydrolase